MTDSNDLEKLVARITPENRHDEIGWSELKRLIIDMQNMRDSIPAKLDAIRADLEIIKGRLIKQEAADSRLYLRLVDIDARLTSHSSAADDRKSC